MADTLRETIGDDLYVSVSQVKSFMLCPRQFELRYVRGLEPEFVPRALAFGTSFHAALARHYVDLRDVGEAPPVEKLIETFKTAWELKKSGLVPLEKTDDEDEPKTDPVDLAAKMLVKFDEHAEAVEKDVVVKAVEQPFTITLFEPDTGEVQEEKLVGVMDLVTEENGVTTVVEHKTAAKKYGADQLRFDHQVTAYQLGMREQFGFNDVGLKYQVITKAKNPQVQVENVTRSMSDEDDFRRVALGVLKSIDAGVSYPVRGWQCRSCPYQSACHKRGR